jgi:hypothetical protein
MILGIMGMIDQIIDKTSGTTRMEEYVPTLDVRNDAGTIELFDYLKKE